MEQRITLVTLGVDDPVRARRFYEELGWSGARQPDDEVVFFQAGPMVLSLWDRRRLAEESRLEDRGGFGGVALAHNVGSREEVDRVMAQAEQAGATITRPAEEMSWGGYSGTFADPDGHAWEVAHNPGWTLGEDGSLTLA